MGRRIKSPPSPVCMPHEIERFQQLLADPIAIRDLGPFAVRRFTKALQRALNESERPDLPRAA